MAPWLVKPNHIAGDDELVLLRAVVVGGIDVGAFEADFGTENEAGSDPVIPRNEMFGVLGFVPRALALDVVEVFVPDRERVLLAELPFHVVGDRPFRRVAPLLPRGAPSAIGAIF